MLFIIKSLKTIKNKFFVKFWFGIIGILLFGYISSGVLYYRQVNQNLKTQTEEHIKSSYSQVENSLSSFIDQYELIAKNIYSTQVVNNFLNYIHSKNKINYEVFQFIRDITSLFDNMQNNSVEINRLLLIALNPDLVTDGVKIISNRSYLDEDIIERVINANGENIWMYHYSKNTGQHELVLLKYLNFRKPGGILVIELDESYLYNMIKFEDQSKNSVFILDNYGTIVSSNDRNMLGKKLNDEFSSYLNFNRDNLQKLTVDGSQKYIFSSNLKDIFNILVIYDVNHLVKDNRKTIIIQFILFSIIVVTTIAFVVIYGDIFAKRVKDIVKKIKKIQEGNKDVTVTIRSHDEFEYMDKSLCEMAYNMSELNKKMIDAINKKNELELKFLQMQIKPHFLYNSLSSIRWLAIQQNHTEIADLMEYLIQFYKISLSKGKDVIPIKDEIELVKSYVALENLIHKDQILLDVYISEALSDMTINKMTLQPFVENSILHGKAPDEPLNIWVSIEEMGSMVKISIEDDGIGIPSEIAEYLNDQESNEKYKNFGIASTITRLKILYGQAEMYISPKEKGTVVDIIIPYLS